MSDMLILYPTLRIIRILTLRKRLPLLRDPVLGLSTTPPLRGYVAAWAGALMSYYFVKRGFENVARILKR
jgi:hypothetical protein